MLEEHKLLHMFLSDYDDLTSWLQDLLQHLRSDDLPQNLKASEEALEVHQERRVSIFSMPYRPLVSIVKRCASCQLY